MFVRQFIRLSKTFWEINRVTWLLRVLRTDECVEKDGLLSGAVFVGALLDGWDCDSCSPNPCEHCPVPLWLPHVKCHVHLKESRGGVSCNDESDTACHACRPLLADPKFRRRKKYLSKDRVKKRAKRNPEKTDSELPRSTWDDSDTESGML